MISIQHFCQAALAFCILGEPQWFSQLWAVSNSLTSSVPTICLQLQTTKTMVSPPGEVSNSEETQHLQSQVSKLLFAI